MQHRRAVLNVLFLADQSIVNLGVFYTSVNVAADPKWSRTAAVRSHGGSRLRTNFGFSIGA
jgi:hypothetical protein